MGNVNIEIPDELHKDLKFKALQSDLTLKDYIIKLLDEKVQRK